jgi:hypothetical protein
MDPHLSARSVRRDKLPEEGTALDEPGRSISSSADPVIEAVRLSTTGEN